MNRTELCVRCDKRLTRLEIAALSQEDIKYFNKLCSKCKSHESKELERLISNPENYRYKSH